MHAEKSRWKKKPGIDAPALKALEAAWCAWAQEDSLPRRDRFEPMNFPAILPWMVLGEIVDTANAVRPYDMLYRYIGTEFAHYFQAQSVTRMMLSEIGQPYAERWFAVTDAARKAKAPCHFKGAPFGTDYEYISLEMLVVPLAGAEGQVSFVLSALARTEELLL